MKLAPESPNDDADDGSANRSHADDGAVSLRDDRVGNAKQKSESQSHCPSGPRQSDSSDHEPNPEPGNESRRDRCLLVGKLMGSMIPMSTAPNTRPQITPSMILDISFLQPTVGSWR